MTPAWCVFKQMKTCVLYYDESGRASLESKDAFPYKLDESERATRIARRHNAQVALCWVA